MESIFPPCDERLLDAIRSCSSAVAIAHRNPDGDALYSTLAMERILKHLGKRVEIVNEGPFLRDDIKMLEERFLHEIDKAFLDTDPLLIILDCSTPDRPGEPFKAMSHLRRIVIDHHSSGIPFTEEGMSYIVPESPSTTMLVDVVRERLGVPLDREMASYLYRGFATDTGFFHFISERTAPECLVRVAAFTAAGVSPYEVYDEMHDGRKLQDIKDTASIILAAVPELDGRVIAAYQGVEMKNASACGDLYQGQGRLPRDRLQIQERIRNRCRQHRSLDRRRRAREGRRRHDLRMHSGTGAAEAPREAFRSDRSDISLKTNSMAWKE